MTQASVRFELSEQFFKDVDANLAKLEIIARSVALHAGVRKALNIGKRRVRQILPKPGYPGDKPGLKPLRDTVSTKVTEYRNRYIVGVVGYEWGAGSHGHIVEHGHRIVVGGPIARIGRQPLREVIAPAAVLKAMKRTGGLGKETGFVPGKFYLQKAIDQVRGQMESAVVEHIQKAIADAEK